MALRTLQLRKNRIQAPSRPFIPAGVSVVYIEAGQSNSNGFSGNPDASFSYTFTQTEVYYKGANNQTNAADNGAFATFALGTNTNREASLKPDPSLFAARFLEENSSNDIRVIQVAEGGTGFKNGTGEWANSGSLRNALENHFIKPGLATLQAQGREVWILPILFAQIEADLRTNANAAAIPAELESFIADIRSYTGISDLPFVITRAGYGLPSGNYSFLSQGQSNQDLVASRDKNVRLISPDSRWEYDVDDVHFTENGYEQMVDDYLKAARELGARKWPGDTSVEISSNPSIGTITAASIAVLATTGEYSTLHVGVYADGSSNPGAAAIKAGTGTGYASSNSVGLIYDQSGEVSVGSLSAETAYEVFAVLTDKAGNDSAVFELSATTSASSSTTEFSDSFTGSDGTLLINHAPETGTGWTDIGVGLRILSNVAVKRAGAAGAAAYVSVVNYASPPSPTVLQVSATTVLVGSAGIILRATNLNTMILIQARQGNNDIRLFERTTGAWSLQATLSSAGIVSGSQSITIEDDDSEIRAQFGSSSVFTHSTTYNQGNYEAGLWVGSTGNGSSYDNFVVTDIAAFTL